MKVLLHLKYFQKVKNENKMDAGIFPESVQIADRFIKSILFVDDRVIWQEENDKNELNANCLTKHFSKKGKICSFYDYKNPGEEGDILKIVHNCDVIVLDWKILIEVPIKENESGDEDVVDKDGRGGYALSLIQNILEINFDSPKVIIILTGENDGDAILNEIKKVAENFTIDANKLFLYNDTFRISIYFKPFLKGQYLNETFKAKIIDYEKLPDILADEFAQITGGLISNVALQSISALRENTNKLLQKYRKQLDPAYVIHRALLPNPEDAEELLKDSIVGSIDSIISYATVSEHANIERVVSWIESNSFENIPLSLPDKKTFQIDADGLKEWQMKGYNGFFEEKAKDSGIKTNPEGFVLFLEKRILDNAEKSFKPSDHSYEFHNEEFAILTHHKSDFTVNGYIPKLCLGVVVESKEEVKKGDGKMGKNYLLCIQQKCDSVRLNPGEQRNFLFLALEIVEKKFSIVYKSGNDFVRLRIINNNCYDLKIIPFSQSSKGMVIAKNKEDGKMSFIDCSGNEYYWVMELKDAHAQRIANEFANKISRVGLDESEWLRRKMKG